MQRILIGIDIREKDTKFRISAAAGMEKEALSKSINGRLYSMREPILLTSAAVTSKDIPSGICACVQRIVEKLYLQKMFDDANRETKNILVITKSKYKDISLPLPHTASNKYVLITIARTIDKESTL